MPLKDVCSSLRCSTIYPEKSTRLGPMWGCSNCDDDLCRIDNEDDLVLGASVKLDTTLLSDDFSKVMSVYALWQVLYSLLHSNL